MITISDGSISIKIEVDGKQVEIASKELDNLSKTATDSGKGMKSAEDGLKGVGKESDQASGNVKRFAKSLGLIAIGAAAFNVLRKSLDSAISRFDTLNNFPKVLEAMGVSAEDAEKSIQRLSDGTDGLPTKLDDIASTAQRMYTSFSDMDKATESAIALNNALLSQSASAEQVSRGTEMYLKALQTGQIDMQTWRSLSETMDVGLVKIAESFGFAGESLKDDLYSALKDGDITINQFNDKLIELGTGTGELASLAQANSLGLATSFKNLQTAVSRNLADIIKKFDELSQAATGKSIAQNIDSLKVVVNAAFQAMGRAIESITPLFVAFSKAVGFAMPAIKALTPAITGLATAYAIHKVIHVTTAALQANAAVMAIVTASKNVLMVATNRLALSLVLAQTRIQLVGIATLAYNKIIAIAVATQALMTTGMSLASIGAIALSGAIHVLNVAIKVLMGPIGWVTLAIGALAGALIGVIKWLKRSTEEGKRMKEQTEEYAESVDELNDSINDSADAYKTQRKEADAQTATTKRLASQIDSLASKENKSAADKQKLATYIEQLNGEVDGLSLAYDAEADSLSMSSEQLKDRIGLMDEATSYTDAMERQLEISKEQSEVVASLAENNALQEEWNQKLDDGIVTQGEYNESMDELIEREGELKIVNENLSIQYGESAEEIEASMKAIATAVENGAASQMVSFEVLSQTNQQLVEDLKATWEDYYDAATDMFDRLSDESTMTVAEMQKNLEENHRIIGEWAEGIASLAERGVDEGLLDTLREAGPESAGHVAALVNASDEELANLSGVFAERGEVATKALSDSLGMEKSAVLDVVGHLVTDISDTLAERVKAANFHEIGIDIVTGKAKGIEEGTPEAEKAAQEMADRVTKTTEDALGINSPSRVFKEIGEHTAGGLELGISSGTLQVINAMEALAFNMINEFKNNRSDFNSIGYNAMQGLNSGLNAGSAQVMNTARRIANNVAATMKQALAIRSPSRLFRDEIGAMIPAGITVGIEDNADDMFRTIKAMGTTMIDVAKPEVALGAFADAGLRGSTTNNSSVTNITNNTNHSNEGTGVVEATLEIDGHNFATVTAPYMSKELNRRAISRMRTQGIRRP